jgi:ABC-type antimicrobial peptide transport system permease subunit
LLLWACFSLPAGCIASSHILVAQRTRELGVRMALGAPRIYIIRLATQSSFAAILAGTAVGLALTLAFSGIFAAWTMGDTRDPVILTAEVVVLFTSAALASIIPARLATMITPMEALRVE